MSERIIATAAPILRNPGSFVDRPQLAAPTRKQQKFLSPAPRNTPRNNNIKATHHPVKLVTNVATTTVREGEEEDERSLSPVMSRSSTDDQLNDDEPLEAENVPEVLLPTISQQHEATIATMAEERTIETTSSNLSEPTSANERPPLEGVYMVSGSKQWTASIIRHGRPVYLGICASKEEAELMFNSAAKHDIRAGFREGQLSSSSEDDDNDEEVSSSSSSSSDDDEDDKAVILRGRLRGRITKKSVLMSAMSSPQTSTPLAAHQKKRKAPATTGTSTTNRSSTSHANIDKRPQHTAKKGYRPIRTTTTSNSVNERTTTSNASSTSSVPSSDHQQQHQQQQEEGALCYIGMTPASNGSRDKWKVLVHSNGATPVYLGIYDTAREAALANAKYRLEHGISLVPRNRTGRYSGDGPSRIVYDPSEDIERDLWDKPWKVVVTPPATDNDNKKRRRRCEHTIGEFEDEASAAALCAAYRIGDTESIDVLTGSKTPPPQRRRTGKRYRDVATRLQTDDDNEVVEKEVEKEDIPGGGGRRKRGRPATKRGRKETSIATVVVSPAPASAPAATTTRDGLGTSSHNPTQSHETVSAAKEARRSCSRQLHTPAPSVTPQINSHQHSTDKGPALGYQQDSHRKKNRRTAAVSSTPTSSSTSSSGVSSSSSSSSSSSISTAPQAVVLPSIGEVLKQLQLEIQCPTATSFASSSSSCGGGGTGPLITLSTRSIETLQNLIGMEKFLSLFSAQPLKEAGLHSFQGTSAAAGTMPRNSSDSTGTNDRSTGTGTATTLLAVTFRLGYFMEQLALICGK